MQINAANGMSGSSRRRAARNFCAATREKTSRPAAVRLHWDAETQLSMAIYTEDVPASR